jgi:hypothetical protein
MGTAKAVGENGPVLEPTNAMFYADTNRTQSVVKGFLLCGQLWRSVKPSEGAKSQSGSPQVVMMQAMENGQPDDLPQRPLRKRREQQWYGNLLVNPLMRTTVMEQGNILADL